MAEVEFVTFGCRLNAFESEVMRRHAAAAGLADAVVVHSCMVTAEAEKQACQAVRRARRRAPDATIVVTGCAAQIAPARFAAMAEVDHVIGNAEKLRPATWQALARGSGLPRQAVAPMAAHRPVAAAVTGFERRTRALLEIQQGCDHHCTFCVIPQGRGAGRSLSPTAIAAQARLLVEHGARELVVTGVDIASYGRDLVPPVGLGAMLAELLAAVPELARLRLSSLDPAAVDPGLERLIASEPRLMPHLHLSIQAGDDLVLKRMRRRHSRADLLHLARRLRRLRPDMVLGADMIAGFPTEDEAMAERSRALIGEAGITHLHVFPYSPRPGTAAARMPQVAPELRRERAARLRAVGEAALLDHLDGEIGRLRPILVERDGTGRTPGFAKVALAPDQAPAAGTLLAVRIAGRRGAVLEGRPAA